MSDFTTGDSNYEKIIENYSKVEELEKKINELDEKIVNLENKLTKSIENNNYIEKSQTKSVEPKKIENNESKEKEEVKESKLDISKFIEVFSQEFDFINKEQFNEEMENDEIMNKIIELIKRMLGIKNDKIEKQKKEDTYILKEKIKEIEDLKEEKKKNAKNIEKFMEKYKDKKKELESIGDLLQARKLYNKYLSMETRILSKLENVLIQRDFESFISSGYTLSSLDNVWDIVKIEYKNISSEDKETLKEVFAFFLNQINKRFKEAKYGLVQVEVGEDFDAVNQVDLSQNSRGRVTECVFYGYGFLKEKENPSDEDVVTRTIKSPLVLTV